MKAKPIVKLKCYVLFVAFLFSSVISLSWAGNTGLGSPEQVVSDLQASLIQSMREGDKMNFQARYDFLAPAINQSHNFDLIIRTVLGSHWDQLDQDQQQLILNTFKQLSIATYAGQFNEYGGEHFEILHQRSLPRNQQLVRSQLTKADGGTVDFDYVLQEGENSWLIINILVDGVSDLALKRTEYRTILQRDGFSALIEMLQEKIVLAEHG